MVSKVLDAAQELLNLCCKQSPGMQLRLEKRKGSPYQLKRALSTSSMDYLPENLSAASKGTNWSRSASDRLSASPLTVVHGRTGKTVSLSVSQRSRPPKILRFHFCQIVTSLQVQMQLISLVLILLG